MANEYPSIFTPGKMINAANHITEHFIQRCCEMDNSGRLPSNFWNLTKYKNSYVREISQAHVLLRKYDVRAILNAMKSKKAYYIRSMRNKNFIPIIEEQQKILPQKEEMESPPKEIEHRAPISNNKNILSNLD